MSEFRSAKAPCRRGIVQVDAQVCSDDVTAKSNFDALGCQYSFDIEAGIASTDTALYSSVFDAEVDVTSGQGASYPSFKFLRAPDEVEVVSSGFTSDASRDDVHVFSFLALEGDGGAGDSSNFPAWIEPGCGLRMPS